MLWNFNRKEMFLAVLEKELLSVRDLPGVLE
jgi:hypothetical protein